MVPTREVVVVGQQVIPYESPSLMVTGDDEITSHAWLWFAVFVFSWSTALWYAWYCRSHGGYPSISVGWSGFKIGCYR
jgi:hypothetical protein